MFYPARIQQNTLIIPPTLAALLVVATILHAIINNFWASPSLDDGDDEAAGAKTLRDIVLHHGGWTRFIMLQLRVIGCLALVSTSAFSLPSCFATEDTAADRFYRCPSAWLALTYASLPKPCIVPRRLYVNALVLP